jgi:hypothetical protein
MLEMDIGTSIGEGMQDIEKILKGAAYVAASIIILAILIWLGIEILSSMP